MTLNPLSTPRGLAALCLVAALAFTVAACNSGAKVDTWNVSPPCNCPAEKFSLSPSAPAPTSSTSVSACETRIDPELVPSDQFSVIMSLPTVWAPAPATVKVYVLFVVPVKVAVGPSGL